MTRPKLREPHPVRAVAVICGAVAAGGWLVMFGLQSVTLRGYLSWTLIAGLCAWLAACALARAGNRGVATGVAAAAGVAWAVAALQVLAEWIRLGVWPV